MSNQDWARSQEGQPQAEPVCPRHPDRVAYVRCQRCGRPACPQCQRPAAVGIQCVDCVQQQARSVRSGTTVFGGRVTEGRPLVTMVIIGICVVVWLAEMASPRVYQQVAFASFLGDTQPWRFLTSAFAHSPTQPLHILLNMYALWILGTYLEPLLGRARFAVLYLVSAFGGSVVWLLLSNPPTAGQANTGVDPGHWTTGMVGASGAVFGLFGALLVLNRKLGRSSTWMYATLLINAVFGLVVPGIAWQAHLGGFIVGLAGAAVIAYVRHQHGRGHGAQHWIGLVGIAALLVALTVVKYALVGGTGVG